MDAPGGRRSEAGEAGRLRRDYWEIRAENLSRLNILHFGPHIQEALVRVQNFRFSAPRGEAFFLDLGIVGE